MVQIIADNLNLAFWAFMWGSMMAAGGLAGLGQLFTRHTVVNHHYSQPKDGPDAGDS